MMPFLAAFARRVASPSVVWQDTNLASTKIWVKMKQEHLHMNKNKEKLKRN